MTKAFEIEHFSSAPLSENEFKERLTLRINLGLSTGKRRSKLTLGNAKLLGDYLIVHVDMERDAVWVSELDTAPKLPIKLSHESVLLALEEKKLEVIRVDFDPKALRSMDELTESEQKMALERFEVIRDLIEDPDTFFVKNKPSKFVQRIAEHTGRSRSYIYNCVNAYLHYGQRIPALALPIGTNIYSEAKGERELYVKQGRPNETVAAGKVLDKYDIKNFKEAKRIYDKAPYPTLISVFKDLSRKHYYAERTKLSKVEAARTAQEYRVKLLPLSERPTIYQFRYWLLKQYDGVLPARDRKRHNRREFKKDIAGRTGNAFTNCIAFGQIFEIDETPFDEELVSVFDPTRRTKIGKATLYFVVDRFSGYIVGVYITTENPSYKTVRQAIYNAAIDKHEFIRSLGLNPDVVKWNFFGVASSYFVDNAEFRNKKSEGVIADLNISIKFARGGRGDDKPNVEKMFDVFSEWFRNISVAHQTKSAADIAAQVARKNACLTINELYVIAVIYIQYHNNFKERSSSFDLPMIQDDVKPIPAYICEWSEKYRPGYIKHFDPQELYRKLLARGEVTVHRKGIHMLGTSLWYNCQYMLETGRQHRKSRSPEAELFYCRYNESLVDWILIETPDGLQLAHLDHKCRAYRGLSFYEVMQQKAAEKKTSAEYKHTQLEYEVGVIEAMDSIFKQAKSEREHSSVPKLSTIKMSRRAEELINRFMDTVLYLELIKDSIAESNHEIEIITEDADETQNDSFYGDL